MYLGVRTSVAGNVTIIALEGQITLGESSGDLRDAIKDAMASGATNILLDLADVTYIDSAGMGEIVGAWVAVARRGHTLKLVHLQRRVEGMMKVTRLLTVLESFEDRDEALRSFDTADSAMNS
jgi:anti-sigma B factor antagonist